MELADKELSSKKFTRECSEAYLSILRSFIHDNIVVALSEERRKHGMFDALEKEEEWDADTDLSMGASGSHLFCFSSKEPLDQIYTLFLQMLISRSWTILLRLRRTNFDTSSSCAVRNT